MYLHNKNIPWSELTTSLKKKELYSSDFYFELSYKTAVDNIRNDVFLKLINTRFYLLNQRHYF